MNKAAIVLAPVLLGAFAQSLLAQSGLEMALQATVTIEVAGPDGVSHGSGFITSSEGMIVTAAHVIERATSAVVRLQNGEELEVEGVVTIDSDKDFAIVRVAGFDLPTVPLGNADGVSVGQRVIAIGAPEDPTFAGTVSDGLVSSDRMLDGTRMLQISVPVSPGSSGGPVLTEQGEVIGLVVSGVTREGVQNLNFALPINYVRGQLALASTRTLQTLAEVSAATASRDPDAPVSTFGSVTASDDYEELVLGYLNGGFIRLQSVLREEGASEASIFHVSVGALDESEQDTISLTLPRAEAFIFTAECDEDCSDIDLISLDALGNILEEDREDDASPILFLTSEGSIQVVVDMYECSVEPCYYGLGVYRVESDPDSGPRETAGQGPASGEVVTGQTLEALRSLAEQGLDSAQYNLGVMYRDGIGVPRDNAEAVRWFRIAADQAFAPAQYNLGVMYRDGIGVPRDNAEAVRWYQLAADQGDADAQYSLGAMYAGGEGVPQDYTEALRLFGLSADQGDVLAQFSLGYMYAGGEGVPQDYREAVRWFRLAADQGNAPAQYNLGVMYRDGIGVPRDNAEAVRWYQLAADQGDADAQYSLGAMYADGEGVPQDYTEALRLFGLSADQGDVLAQFSLGYMYDFGDGIPEDNAEAVRWYQLAADQGDAGAQFSLGAMYAGGEGVPQDYTEALRLFRLSADQGDVLAQFSLGYMYANGEGVPQDNVLAYMWYNLAAAQGDENAQSDIDVLEEQMTREQIAEAQRLSREWIEEHGN